ncbi:ABC transporter ATP-binding protein [Microbacterium sp.]|uniref:ABC transporter ATP-binding protein n=1 Tax=Microbacterium sp. TaxID=51671 RepID=UPI002D76FE8D|nr:ABC transporter ATP-binding protein [Microbacterium sp.]HET6300926.1 ABC transporter ATP-binding protein [Microbacterium sp.]
MVLTVRDLHAGYRTARVLNGVDLEVADGESVALMGRNGMGKTTLLRAISRLSPPVVFSGSVVLDGVELLQTPPHRVAEAGSSLVPQGRQVFGSLTVRENLSIVPRPRDREAWTVERVFDLFPRLEERERAVARTLSGGEQQMLAIGRALMSGPKLLLMDEPSEGLAPAVLRVIGERLQELRATGLSVLVAEQNVDFAMSLSDRVLILGEHGSIVWTGSRADLIADPAPIHRHLGL